jgi:hypothetical protein
MNKQRGNLLQENVNCSQVDLLIMGLVIFLLPFVFWSQSDNCRFEERAHQLVPNDSTVTEVTASILCQELLHGWKRNGWTTKL